MSSNWRIMYTSVGKLYGIPAGEGKYKNLLRAMEQAGPDRNGNLTINTLLVPMDTGNIRREYLINNNTVIAQATLHPKDDADLIKNLDRRVTEIAAANSGITIAGSSGA